MGKQIYTEEQYDTVLLRLETTPLRQICRDHDMPSMGAVLTKVERDPAFAERYARARSMLLENMAEETLDIADDGSNDWQDRETESGRIMRVVDQEHIQRSKLRVDTRKWLLSKLRPDKYGDKLTHEVPEPIEVVVRSVLDKKE